MPTNQELSMETRRKIVDTFWNDALEVGINKINVKSLMTRVGMNRSTFYEHFSSIDDLVSKSEEEMLEEISRKVTQLSETIPSGDFPPVNILLDIFPLYGNRIMLLMDSMDDQNFFDKLLRCLQPSILKAYGIKCNEEESTRIARFILMSACGVLREHIREGSDESRLIDELIKTQKLIFYGVRLYTDG